MNNKHQEKSWKQLLTIILIPSSNYRNTISHTWLQDLLPFEIGQTANEQTRKFLLGVIKICLDYIERENDRSEKVIDFYQPEEMMKMFDFSIPESPLELDRLIEDCKRTLSYQVKTGEYYDYVVGRRLEFGRIWEFVDLMLTTSLLPIAIMVAALWSSTTIVVWNLD